MSDRERELELKPESGESVPATRRAEQAIERQAIGGMGPGRPKSWQGRVRSRLRSLDFRSGQASVSPATTRLSPRNAPPDGQIPESQDFGGEMSAEGLSPRVVDVERETCGPWTGGDLEYESARADLLHWIQQGPRGPSHVQAPTGLGGFQVLYDPKAGIEFVRIDGEVEFVDTLVLENGRVIAKHKDVQGLVEFINGYRTEEEKKAAIAEWQWSEAEKQQFVKKLEKTVEGFWGFSTVFHCSRRYWEDLGARPSLDVSVHPGKKRPKDHLSITAYKVPEHKSVNVGEVKSQKGRPHDNQMTLASSDVNPREDNLLKEKLLFEPGSAGLSAPQRQWLSALAKRVKAGSKDPPILWFRVGAVTERLAKKRFEALASALSEEKVERSRLRYEYAGTGDEVTIMIGSGAAQTVAVHEFGHQLGLSDEYAVDEGSGVSGTGKPAGEPCDHEELAKGVGLPGCVHENNDSIMSVGTAFRRGHAAVYLWALQQVTGMREWTDGPPVEVKPPSQRRTGE